MKDSRLALRWGVFGLLISFAIAGVCRGQNYIRIESEAEARAREKIEIALSGIGSIDCVDKPLHELVSDLSRRMGVSIVLAKEALNDAAISLDTPVTAQISGVSYRSLLRLVLKELKLTWTFHSEVILITTPRRRSRCWRPGSIPCWTRGGNRPTPDSHARGARLRHAHRDDHTTVEPDSWMKWAARGRLPSSPAPALW
jgi:hypothetical protein